MTIEVPFVICREEVVRRVEVMVAVAVAEFAERFGEPAEGSVTREGDTWCGALAPDLPEAPPTIPGSRLSVGARSIVLECPLPEALAPFAAAIEANARGELTRLVA